MSEDKDLIDSLLSLNLKIIINPNNLSNFSTYNILVDSTSLPLSEVKKILSNTFQSKSVLIESLPDLELQLDLLNLGVKIIECKEDLFQALVKIESCDKPNKSIKVVLLDDSELDRFIISNLLKQSGFTVFDTASPRKAYEILEVQNSDVLLVDINMPEPFDGVSFVRLVRNNSRFATTPIIFVTSEESIENKLQALEAGGDDLFPKPLLKDLSIRLINKHVHRSRQQIDLIMKDNLTNIHNRNYLTKKKTSLEASPSNLYLCLLDIDHFKAINDTYGHYVGDIVLKHLSAIMKRLIRNDDLLVRFGGEEFIIIIESESDVLASNIFHRIKDSISRVPVLIGKEKIFITYSSGLVRLGSDLDDAIKKADELLYKAKNYGRNCIISDPNLKC